MTHAAEVSCHKEVMYYRTFRNVETPMPSDTNKI
jgi:hypothetical protein